ncbi:hypothetical protein BJ944DRAFT_263853 [Cunninghamella echinulata]|nr:hypothetical protein BJ944DRAFT_263853 [Cunninghamella echinulata]
MISFNKSLHSLLLIILLYVTIHVHGNNQPCITSFQQQQQQSMDSLTCQDMCSEKSTASIIDWEEGNSSNGICVFNQCYCTDVGIGDCKDWNHEGCDDVCQQLDANWFGECFNQECHCLT